MVLLLTLSLFGCEGARNNSSWSTAKPGDAIQPPLTTSDQNKVATSTAPSTTTPPPATATEGTSGRGVGPVDHVDVASLDAARAMKGAEIFTTKCSACHKLCLLYTSPSPRDSSATRMPS